MAAGSKLLILTEAGEGIGFGHYARCLAIKKYFESKGAEAEMMLNVKGDQQNFVGVQFIDWQTMPESLNSDGSFSHVLVDSYLAPAAIFGSLTGNFRKVVAIDDYHRVDQGPDLIINPNVYGNVIPYTAPSVGGKEFVILRDSFRAEVRKLEIKKDLSEVMITLGGSDLRGLMPQIIELLMNMDWQMKLNVVAGSNSYASELRKALGEHRLRSFFGFLNETEMKALMLRCDIAISACGQTLHELTWLGVPVVGVCIGEDQVMNMKEYGRLGVLPHEIRWNDPDWKETLKQSVCELRPYEVRRERAANSSRILNSNGLSNIYREILR